MSRHFKSLSHVIKVVENSVQDLNEKQSMTNFGNCSVCFLNHLQIPIHLIFFLEGDHESIPENTRFQTELDLFIKISNFPSMNLPQKSFFIATLFHFLLARKSRKLSRAGKKNCNSSDSLTFVFRRESHELPLD